MPQWTVAVAASRGVSPTGLTLAAVAFAAAAVTAQDPAAPADLQVPGVDYHVEVNYVEVDARVVDGDGSFVRDLTRDDFEILEDGVPQKIDRFSLVEIPLERPEVPSFVARPIDDDVSTNAQEYEGRLYLIVLDDLHVAPLRTQQARDVARRFIETRLAVNDQAAVVTTRGSSLEMQGFTSSRSLLIEAVNNFVGQKLESAVTTAINAPQLSDDQDEDARFAPGSNQYELQRVLNATASMTTLRNAAEFMAGIRGRRKALIYISEGIDYDVYDSVNNREATYVTDASRDAAAAATRANVAIYSIDPRGLSAGVDDLAELRGTSTGSIGAADEFIRELQTSHDGLRELSDLTGGFAAVNAADTGAVYDQIVEENSAYYVLAYYSANGRREGRARRIDVRVRRPGLQVFSKDSYIEPRGHQELERATSIGDVPVNLVEALRSPLPLRGLTLSATAAAFRGADGKASLPVVVEVRGDQLGLFNEGTRYTGLLDVAAWAVNTQGGPGVSEHRQAALSLTPETYQRVLDYGLKVVMRLEVPPGRYQLRVGALAPDTAVRGSVFYDLDVPDFSNERLTMSNVVLTSAVSSRVLTAQADEQLSAVLPASPTAAREFPVGDQIAILTEIYDNDRRPHMVDISSSILTAEGETVFTSTQSRSSEDFDDGTFGVVYEVPLLGYAPGLYVLRVEAESQADRSARVVREVQFRVRG